MTAQSNVSTTSAILVLGMHRSGTSALARVISFQGACLPNTLMLPQDDNPEGFWESRSIVKTNNQFLAARGLTWDDPRPIPNQWFSDRAQEEYVARAVKVLGAEFPHGNLLVVKDPRLSRLAPIWISALRQVNIQPLVVICCRNPLEVVASLQQRNGLDIAVGQLLWLTYMLDVEVLTRSVPRAVIHFSELLKDRRQTLSNAYLSIGLGLIAQTGDEAMQVDAFLSSSLRHHVQTTEELLCRHDVIPLIKEVYVAFLAHPLPQSMVFDGLRHRIMDVWEDVSTFGTDGR